MSDLDLKGTHMTTATPIVLPVETMHELALELLDEIDEHADKIFCVASGGLAYADPHKSATEAGIFQVIKDMSSSIELSGSLRRYVDQLAVLAGSKLKMKAVPHD